MIFSCEMFWLRCWLGTCQNTNRRLWGVSGGPEILGAGPRSSAWDPARLLGRLCLELDPLFFGYAVLWPRAFRLFWVNCWRGNCQNKSICLFDSLWL